ncbi:hypothetical protein LCGC14_2592080 [marine sediment metagenome]|uniref:Uncharacterized protein n=1 Tax=marine sediment metagenome TaxID=412755 RepID=A0A0F9D419_9ZZZZ
MVQRKPKVKDGYPDVPPNTKKYGLLQLMIIKGVTVKDGDALGIHRTTFSTYVESLKSMNGYNITVTSIPHPNYKGRFLALYRVIGRWTWDGDYVSTIRGVRNDRS